MPHALASLQHFSATTLTIAFVLLAAGCSSSRGTIDREEALPSGFPNHSYEDILSQLNAQPFTLEAYEAESALAVGSAAAQSLRRPPVGEPSVLLWACIFGGPQGCHLLAVGVNPLFQLSEYCLFVGELPAETVEEVVVSLVDEYGTAIRRLVRDWTACGGSWGVPWQAFLR